jgi:hypothetical protein
VVPDRFGDSFGVATVAELELEACAEASDEISHIAPVPRELSKFAGDWWGPPQRPDCTV